MLPGVGAEPQRKAHRFFQGPQSSCHLLPCAKPEQLEWLLVDEDYPGFKPALEGRGNFFRVFLPPGLARDEQLCIYCCPVVCSDGGSEILYRGHRLRGLTLGVAGLPTPRCHQKHR